MARLKVKFELVRISLMLTLTTIFLLIISSSWSSGEPLLNAYDVIKPATGFDDVKLGWSFDHFSQEYKRPIWSKTKKFKAL